jgi:polysaccharide pyruvyl transferase WcaK-like protein
MPAQVISDNTVPKRVCLLGASFDTGNLGISALAESSIKLILSRWPNAEIVLFNGTYEPQRHGHFISDGERCIKTLRMRFCKNIFLQCHFLRYVLYGVLMKVLPTPQLKERLACRNQDFKVLFETEFVVDITGGDSFSDIYSFRRFFLGFLQKWLVIFLGKKLILLPQTYGPFRKPITRVMARYILLHAQAVYSRDRAGVEYVHQLLNNHRVGGKVKLSPDVAFILDSRKPDNFDVSPLSKIPKAITLVGFNVSGLLFNGGYTRDNAFGLKADYRTLIPKLVRMFLENKDVVVLLVPHVFPPSNFKVESDPDACLRVYEQLRQEYSDRLFLVEGKYDQGEIKYIIGLCDFFIGSRMHSCIAALSQCIPAVGIAYSKKFHGVFESIGLTECVADARSLDEQQVLEKVEFVFEHESQMRDRLEHIIPQVKGSVLNLFKDYGGR